MMRSRLDVLVTICGVLASTRREHAEQSLDVREVQAVVGSSRMCTVFPVPTRARGRAMRCASPPESAGEGWPIFVAEPHVVEGPEAARDVRVSTKILRPLAHRHRERVRDAAFAIEHAQRGVVEAPTLQISRATAPTGQEVHLDLASKAVTRRRLRSALLPSVEETARRRHPNARPAVLQ